MSTTASDRELTVREAAQRADRAEETIRRWIWTGRLPARKRGRGYRVSQVDLDAVAGGVPALREAGKAGISLAEWVERVDTWRTHNGVPPRGGAGQLVIEDRAARAAR